MKYLLLILVTLCAINGNGQFTNQVHRTMPGTFRGYGMDPLRGTYTVHFSDGKHYSGSGTIKKDGDKQILKIRGINGKKIIQKAEGTSKLIFQPENNSLFSKEKEVYEFVTINNQHWMVSAGGSIPELYYAIQQTGTAAILKGTNIELASLDDVLKIIGNHKQAEKFARKGEYDRAFAEFNGTSTSMYRSGKKGDPKGNAPEN